mmetsp:Transcript_9137/g.20794  ORF Transcript_9137/g.20794 Transcript_9137/m.20794 type:complete len:245 (-) Transcript_9137:157-891(-)
MITRAPLCWRACSSSASLNSVLASLCCSAASLAAWRSSSTSCSGALGPSCLTKARKEDSLLAALCHRANLGERHTSLEWLPAAPKMAWRSRLRHNASPRRRALAADPAAAEGVVDITALSSGSLAHSLLRVPQLGHFRLSTSGGSTPKKRRKRTRHLPGSVMGGAVTPRCCVAVSRRHEECTVQPQVMNCTLYSSASSLSQSGQPHATQASSVWVRSSWLQQNSDACFTSSSLLLANSRTSSLT